jgi:hypothetical protein
VWFLAQTNLDLGGVWSFNVPVILPNEPVFNFFFALVMAFGLVAVPVALLVKLISRS